MCPPPGSPSWLVHRENGETIALDTDLLILDLMLHEYTLELVPLREPVELLLRNGPHESGLSTLGRPVEAITLQVHLRIPTKRQGAVNQGGSLA